MDSVKKIILALILIPLLAFVFVILDVGLEVNQFIQDLQPIIFAITVIICIFYLQFRRYILIISLILLFSMIVTYLFNMIEASNWIGSLGFGGLFITVFSYFPQFIRSGYIEKY